jgi:ApaG protein
VSEDEHPVSTSEATTEGIRVRVCARYEPERSAPSLSQWFFLYTITITNESEQQVQLLSRRWLIIDATGKTEEVHGPGVVGQQPTLAPGQSFEYTSGCPLTTPFGSMAGTYQMTRGDGTHFDAEIRMFQLSQPHAIH